MRIGELADALGISAKTVRFYEDRGLLPHAERLANGYRDYPASAVERVRFVKAAQGAGLTLAEIGEILAIKGDGGSSCGHTRALIDRHIAELDSQMERLRAARVELVALAERASELDPASCTDPDRCQVIALDLPVQGKVYRGDMIELTPVSKAHT